jgi:hypothetical protein
MSILDHYHLRRPKNQIVIGQLRPLNPTPERSSTTWVVNSVPTGNQVARQFAQSCPLRLPGPSNCPFGGACHKCPAPRVQAKLKIGKPDDEYEREADRVADQVMRMHVPLMQESTLGFVRPSDRQIQRACVVCDEELHRQPLEEEEEEEILQTKENPNQAPQVTSQLTGQINNIHGRGRPLPESVRAFFEPRFGYDFRAVRIHTDTQAANMAQTVKAKAFTIGRDVVFGTGQYSQGTTEGKRLLAHELTHVVQQVGDTPITTDEQDLGNLDTSSGKHLRNTAGDILRERELSSVIQRQACFDGATITVSKAGRSHSCPAFTSSTAPTPLGQHCIRRQGEAQISGGIVGRLFQDRSRWYLLEPQFTTTRSRMQLHPGTRSTGCITVTNSDCYDQLAGVLNTRGTVRGFGYDGYPPGNAEGVTNPRRAVNCVAMLTVTSTTGGCSLP